MSSEATPLESVGFIGPAIDRVLDMISADGVEITGPATSVRLPGDRESDGVPHPRRGPARHRAGARGVGGPGR